MRYVAGGINWIWYHTDTREEAVEWYKELTGVEPEDYCIVNLVTRTPSAEHDYKYGFRIHR